MKQSLQKGEGRDEDTKKRTEDIGCLLLFSSTLLGSQTARAWWDTDWGYRVMLRFDNSGQTENLTDFPVLVKLTTSRVDYNHIQSDGDDIRFVDSDDSTELYFEVEEWSYNGTSYFWVKVPQIDGSSSSAYIYLYYGNDSAGPSAYKSAGNVWSDDLEAVYHWNGNTNDSIGNHNGTIGGGQQIRRWTSSSGATDPWAHRVIDRLDGGLLLVNHLGHGSLEMWRGVF